ncbi:hypothetical protein TMatcc_008098 [Talaromyces marneffei ATCC 18224]
MAALVLRITAAPVEIDDADVADVVDVPEKLKSRDNWCHHAGITCWAAGSACGLMINHHPHVSPRPTQVRCEHEQSSPFLVHS